MERLDARVYERPHYSFHGGTFTANPITMTAGLATLKILEDGRLINKLNRLGDKIREELREIFEAHDVDVQVTGASSLFNTHFTKNEVKDANAVFRADRKKLVEYNLRLIENCVFLLPTHTGALSTAHSKADVEKLLSETEKYAKTCKKA
jgi:glutamate-1-semialdehyde 2,1-aminomutase